MTATAAHRRAAAAIVPPAEPATEEPQPFPSSGAEAPLTTTRKESITVLSLFVTVIVTCFAPEMFSPNTTAPFSTFTTEASVEDHTTSVGSRYC